MLVTGLGDQLENVRSFCLSRPNSDDVPHFRCDWLLGMLARQGWPGRHVRRPDRGL